MLQEDAKAGHLIMSTTQNVLKMMLKRYDKNGDETQTVCQSGRKSL